MVCRGSYYDIDSLLFDTLLVYGRFSIIYEVVYLIKEHAKGIDRDMATFSSSPFMLYGNDVLSSSQYYTFSLIGKRDYAEKLIFDLKDVLLVSYRRGQISISMQI